MIKIFFLIVYSLILIGCSFNKDSKFWTSTTPIKLEKDFNEIFTQEKKVQNEFNSSLKIKLNYANNKNTTLLKLLNNDGMVNFNSDLKKSSRYNFSKIKISINMNLKFLFIKKTSYFLITKVQFYNLIKIQN